MNLRPEIPKRSNYVAPIIVALGLRALRGLSSTTLSHTGLQPTNSTRLTHHVVINPTKFCYLLFELLRPAHKLLHQTAVAWRIELQCSGTR